MKNKKTLFFLFTLLALLLTACKVNFITKIEKDGSGTYVQEIGFQGDEASMAGLSAGEEGFCAKQNEEMPPGTSIRQETRNEDETWCVYETPFDSLEALKAIYGMTDTQVYDISLVNGVLTYDLSLDLSGDSAPMGAEIAWVVSMPGTITETNATQQDGNTLTWTLVGGQVNQIRAVSEVGGFNLGGGSNIMYILGGIALLCLCCFVPLIIGGVTFFLLRKKKAATTEESAP